MFVGGLHLDTDNESLREYFERYGEVFDSVVMRDGESRKSRGFGFVTFSDESQGTACLQSGPHVLNGKEVSL